MREDSLLLNANIFGVYCCMLALGCQFFDCWSEVFCPIISRFWVPLGFMASVAQIISFSLVLVTTIIAVYRRMAPRLQQAMTVRVGLCILLLLATKLKCEFFCVGAASRVFLSGGADSVRQSILMNFMDPNTNQLRVTHSNPPTALPSGMRDTEPPIIFSRPTEAIIQIPARHCFSDTFCYVILLDENDVCQVEAWRTWKIGKGFYFCETKY